MEQEKYEGGTVLPISVEKIIPNPNQPRFYFEGESQRALAESIKRYGILQPLTVRKNGERYELIAGERRFRAAKEAGLSTVPCLIYQMTEKSSAFLAVVENLQRQDLNLFEMGLAIEKLISEYGLTQEEVALRLSVSQSYVANKLRLLKLSPACREIILENGLTERHARAVLRLKEEEREAVLRTAVLREMNVSAAERTVEEKLRGKKPKPVKKRFYRGAIKDLRLFYNSVDRAVDIVKRCGVAIQSEKKQEEDGMRITIFIPT
ncbi:MAG: ParB/RepB/Spo0J family partition protein [Clostridia bacterium]|nr:ParB/RepB/Spo0J family partition protein [Clostridia bacterium]